MTARRFLWVTVAVDVALCVLGVGLAAALAPRDVTLGIAVGGALGTVNLVALAWLSGRLLRPAGAKWPYGLALAGKFALLIAAVYAAMVWVPMDVVGFVGGLSASALATVVGAGYLAARNGELTFEPGPGR